MKVNISLLAGILSYSILTTHSAWADTCQNPQTQAELNRCAALLLDEANQRINLTYNNFRAKLNQKQKQQLKEVQLAWINYKDLACQFETAQSAGGSARPMALANCLAEKTRQRNKELEILGVCQEGDLNCPAW